MTRQSSITAEIEVEIDADNVAYPQINIRYSFLPGYPATGPTYASGGEPACGPEIELVSASLAVADGLAPTAEQIDKWAETYLASDAGFDAVMHDLRD